MGASNLLHKYRTVHTRAELAEGKKENEMEVSVIDRFSKAVASGDRLLQERIACLSDACVQVRYPEAACLILAPLTPTVEVRQSISAAAAPAGEGGA